MPADPALDAAAQAARALAGRPAASIERVRGYGRNSGVYRLRAGGAVYALKQYPPRRPGERDRATVEYAALGFLSGHGIATVPRPIAVDAAGGYLLLEWINGEPVETPEAANIAAACNFLRAIHALRDESDAAAQSLAAEACISGVETAAQIERRLERLAALAGEPALSAFLCETLGPLFGEVLAWTEAGYAAAGLSFARETDAAAQTLCPSDFGFHNAIRRPGGELVFIDFDYFGWDDPVKLTADFLLHPGMRLAEGLKRQFAAEAAGIYGSDRSFGRRLALLYPLFSLRWCTILLNEFLPERWANRLASGGPADWESAKQRQLDRAREWAHSLAANFRRFPYGE
jgi:phosphotransferase family enzyme